MRRFLAPALFFITIFAGCGPQAPKAAPGLPSGEPMPIPSSEMVEHPTYKLWANFKPGASVTTRMTTDSEKTPGKTVTTISYKLTEKTDEHIVVEWQAKTEYHGGRIENNPPSTTKTKRFLPLPDGADKETWGKPKSKRDGGEEVLTVVGKPIRTTWFKSKGSTDVGAMETTTWQSDDVPGGLVKSVSLVPAVEETTTIEIIEMLIP